MKQDILEKLLDKYEKSKHATGEARVRRRVTLKTDELTGYFSHDLEYRKSLHRAALDLENRGLIKIEWVPFEKGNLIKALHLVLDRVEEAYMEAGHKSRLDILGDLENRLAGLNLSIPWASAFVKDCLAEIGGKLKYPSRLPREPKKLELLLNTLKGIQSKGQEEMLERVFSKRYLGSSKAFEQHVRRRLVGILRTYFGGAGMEEEDLLAEVGLVRAASEVLVCGPLKMRLKDRTADLAPFCYGTGLGTETIEAMEIVDCNCRRVISVENKAVFRELVRAGTDDQTLLVCLGGFAGPVKRGFLTKLYGFLGNTVEYYHWGDIDYGGMQIFCHLRRVCIPGLRPLLMDAATYGAFVHLGEKFEVAYRTRLEGLLGQEDFACFHDVINIMLEHGCTLEQEAVPVAECMDILRK
ncbi:Wadjet anti-phage system protein JetD domain-containing protein [Thermincola ferriacetica]